MSRTTQPRKVALPIVILVVVMIGGGVWTGVRSLIDDDRDDRADTDGAVEPDAGASAANTPLERARSTERPTSSTFTIGDGPSGYTVTYEVFEPGRPPVRETIAVARPYESSRTTTVDRSRTSFARLATTPSKGAQTVVSPPPASVDPRPARVIERAIAEGFLVRREQRDVAGAPCQVFRSLAPVSSSTISAALPGKYTDVCLDAEGIVREEWQVDEGRPVRQRVAVSVEVDPPGLAPLDDAPTLTAAQGGGSVLRVDPTSEPQGRFFVLDTPPAGFVLRGRYSIVPPQAGLTDANERRRAIASTADVYERGVDVLIVDRGSTLNLERAFQPRPEGRPVDLGPVLGEGELLLSWNGPEVRWANDDGKFIRVYGTLPVDETIALARSLRETPGGPGLVFLEGQRL